MSAMVIYWGRCLRGQMSGDAADRPRPSRRAPPSVDAPSVRRVDLEPIETRSGVAATSYRSLPVGLA